MLGTEGTLLGVSQAEDKRKQMTLSGKWGRGNDSIRGRGVLCVVWGLLGEDACAGRQLLPALCVEGFRAAGSLVFSVAAHG